LPPMRNFASLSIASFSYLCACFITPFQTIWHPFITNKLLWCIYTYT
jgi:hypothetical protein